MPYDERLAERIRASLSEVAGVTERKMFGGVGFMVDGHMAVGAGSSGSLMVRVSPEEALSLIAGTSAEAMDMRGRKLAGWLLVPSAALEDDGELREWVDRGVAFVRTLPRK